MDSMQSVCRDREMVISVSPRLNDMDFIVQILELILFLEMTLLDVWFNN